MIDRTSRFAKSVSKLKPPSSAAFNLNEWENAFAAGPTTAADQRLLDAARWIGAEFSATAAAFPDPTLASLSPEWSTVLAIAALNRECLAVTKVAVERAIAGTQAGILGFDAITAQHIRTPTGQQAAAADLIGAAIEATESWLFDAARSTGTLGQDILDLAPTAVQAIKFYSTRKMLNALWNHSWHEGWQVQLDEKGRHFWSPTDEKLERLKFAWRSRFEADLMNSCFVNLFSWRHLSPPQRRKLARKRSVLAIRGEKLKVQPIPYISKHMPAYMYDKAMLEGSYVSDFIYSAMPSDPRLSVGILLQAWHVVRDIANLLLPSAPHSTSSLSPGEARRLALAIDRTSLVQAVASALQVSPELAQEIVTFLTFSSQTGGKSKMKGNKGLWAAPLIGVPGSTELLLALPVLTTSMAPRRAEAWLEKGGINDDNPAGARGDHYEVIYRSKICGAIAENDIFAAARCAPNGVAKTASFNEQIDLVVAFGDLCLVGEVKFFLMPLAPHEIERFENKLREAAVQAKRKAAALRERPDVIASALDIAPAAASALALLPIIVTNQGFGFSTRVDGILVIEAGFLLTYLRSGKIVTAMALSSTGEQIACESTALYATEKEAATNFEAQMAAPHILRRILDRVVWKTTLLPTLAHDVTISATLKLEDFFGHERIRAEMLIAKLV